MSLTPAQDNLDAQRKKDAIEKCGKNGGPHDYIPIEWSESNILNGKPVEGVRMKRVTKLLCRVCFNNISTSILIKNYIEIKD